MDTGSTFGYSPRVSASPIASAIRRARAKTNTDPTEAQAAAGNYAKGECTIHGLTIKLENPRDTMRRGKDKDGTPWENLMKADYGYFKNTMAADGDAVDCFIGPAPESEFVVAIDQYHSGGKFDETKFVLGVTTRDEGEKLYLSHYPKNWKLGPVSTTTVGQLKEWLKNGDTHSPFGGQLVKAAGAVPAMPGLAPAGTSTPDSRKASTNSWLDNHAKLQDTPLFAGKTVPYVYNGGDGRGMRPEVYKRMGLGTPTAARTGASVQQFVTDANTKMNAGTSIVHDPDGPSARVGSSEMRYGPPPTSPEMQNLATGHNNFPGAILAHEAEHLQQSAPSFIEAGALPPEQPDPAASKRFYGASEAPAVFAETSHALQSHADAGGAPLNVPLTPAQAADGTGVPSEQWNRYSREHYLNKGRSMTELMGNPAALQFLQRAQRPLVKSGAIPQSAILAAGQRYATAEDVQKPRKQIDWGDRYKKLKERRGECPDCDQPNLPEYNKCTCPKPDANDRTFLPENIDVPEELEKQAGFHIPENHDVILTHGKIKIHAGQNDWECAHSLIWATFGEAEGDGICWWKPRYEGGCDSDRPEKECKELWKKGENHPQGWLDMALSKAGDKPSDADVWAELQHAISPSGLMADLVEETGCLEKSAALKCVDCGAHLTWVVPTNQCPPCKWKSEDAMKKSAVVKQRGDDWLLMTADGTRVLGTHKSADAAYRQEYAIQKSQERAQPEGFETSHTKTMPDGRTLDIIRLMKMLEGRPTEERSLSDIQTPSRSRRDGFSMNRYAKVDEDKPMIVGKDNQLLDGRHRFFKRMDKGLTTARVREAGDDDLDAAEERKFDVVKQLRKAKALSDRRQYSQKHVLLNRLMTDSPSDFYEDSRERNIVGVTHRPSNFRIHIPANKLRAPLEKAAAAQRLMKALGSVTKQAPLFGEEVAQAARKGVSIHRAGSDPIKGAVQGPLQKLVGLLESKTVQDMPTGAVWNNAKNKGGTLVDFVGRVSGNRGKNLAGLQHVGKLDGMARRNRIADSKLREAKEFPELIGRTEPLEAIAAKHGLKPDDHAGLFAALGREFDGKFIVKPDGGYATAASSLVHDKKSPEALRKLMQGGLANNQGENFTKMVAQRRIDLQPINRLERAANNIGEIGMQRKFGQLKNLFSKDQDARTHSRKLLGSMFGGESPLKATRSTTGGTSKEFRVHVVDGKVVPYSTVSRGTVLGMLPLRTPNMGAAERALQEKLNGVDPAKLKGTWGFDVAKGRGADKGFHVIETNPTTIGGSGYLNLPHIRDSIAGALQGRVPRYVLAQKGVLAGAAGIGAAEAAT